MTPVAVLLAVAVAAGPSGQPKRTGIAISNAARAKAGLLPRKPARAGAEVHGRYATVRAPPPTYLPEPAPLADSDPVVDGQADASPAVDGEANASPEVVAAEADASALAAPELVAARGPAEAKRLPDAPAEGEADPPAMPAPISPPDEIGALRAEVSGIVTEVTLSLRFEP